MLSNDGKKKSYDGQYTLVYTPLDDVVLVGGNCSYKKENKNKNYGR